MSEALQNIIDAAPEARAILEAVRKAKSAEFRASLQGMTNPYGDGRASEKIVEVLTTAPLSQELLLKRHAPMPIPEPRALRKSQQ